MPFAYVANGLTGVQATGVVANPVCSAVTAAAPSFNVQFGEAFATAFRVQGSAGSNSSLGSWLANGSETGYGVTSGAASNTATSGTRIKIVLNNIPANVAVYVPVTRYQQRRNCCSYCLRNRRLLGSSSVQRAWCASRCCRGNRFRRLGHGYL